MATKKEQKTIPLDNFTKLSIKQAESLYNFRLREYNKDKTEENKRRLDAATSELRKRGY